MSTIRSLIDQRSNSTPSGVFLICPATRAEVTWAQLQTRARSVTSYCLDQGLTPGTSVGYALGNSGDAACVLLGLMYGGYVATAVNLVSGDTVIQHVLDHSEAALVITDASCRPLVAQANCVEASRVLDHARRDDIAPPHAEDIGLLMYTSGTTGLPKGVQLSHRALIAGGTNTATAHQLTSDDRALCVLPLYHINGLCVTILAPLVSSGSVVLPPKFSVGAFWGLVRDHGCTWFSVVPTQIAYLLHANPDEAFAPIAALRFGRSASAPLAPDVQRAFEDRFQIPIIETMGMTETAAQLLSNPLPPGRRKIGSPGVAVGNEVRIGDENQTELPHGEEGEVLIRGANVMSGYLKNPDATAGSLTDDGWLRSGDLGRMDSDGYVTITGRLKELIIKGGENIAPREIDEALYSDPKVVEAAAFAVPCHQYGERVEAAVVIEVGTNRSEQDLLSLCLSKVGKFKCPERIHFFKELPKGPSGKIQRLKLHEILAG